MELSSSKLTKATAPINDLNRNSWHFRGRLAAAHSRSSHLDLEVNGNEICDRMAARSPRIGSRDLVRPQSRALELIHWRQITLNKIALTLVVSFSLLGLGTVTMAQDSRPLAPDNSAVNVRDRAPDAMTAGEQSNAKNDVELTRQIRRAVVKDDSLSMQAHNVKIVVSNGAVTLRGPVKTEQEKVAIANKAQAIAGPNKVDNQLEVESQ